MRRGILDTLGMPEERLIMALSHTHAGPCTSLLNADQPGGELVWQSPFAAGGLEALVEGATAVLGTVNDKMTR